MRPMLRPYSWRPFRPVCVSLVCLGLLLNGSVLEAAQPACPTLHTKPLVRDVELDAKGSLQGVVVNAEGVPLAGVSVAAYRRGRELTKTSTDGLGYFRLAGLGTGTYQVSAGPHARLFRVWATGTAPPKTKRMVLLVAGARTARGQIPAGEFFASNAALITAIIAGAIAIPIAYHNIHEENKAPSSP